MPIAKQPGRFVFSIDIPSACESTAISAWAVAVAEHLAASRVSATWALDLATNPDLACEVRNADPAHEIAVMADHSWAGRHASRHLVATELEQRTRRAAALGFELRTLVLAEGHVTEHFDLVVKHGITAVRSAARPWRHDAAREPTTWLRRWRGAETATAPVRSLRWGLWEIGPSLDLVGTRHGHLSRAIDQAADGGELVHLSLELTGLTGKVSAGLKLLDRVAAQVAALREERSVQTLTIGDLAARLSRPRQNPPARSILRPAA